MQWEKKLLFSHLPHTIRLPYPQRRKENVFGLVRCVEWQAAAAVFSLSSALVRGSRVNWK